ncbi:DUF2937 family protein [Permianibacter sp. IMCC34836]|uniref:DUF2937 family protein n=1 Tax=Permianibacter fluminis TaxID=2738515 RepID=UPI0015520A92|nr:DUF2937 family protein [Permianibacter fluminis]NQD38235.1 DUF2937 family protein [Permianibacter fluminis]
MFRDYIRLMVFAVGLLAGVQLPAFVDQYAKRVDAHYLEAKGNFAGFQDTADRHFNGDVDAMIQHHRQSGDVVFQEDADSIEKIWQRLQLLAAEQLAMQKPFPLRAFHALFAANDELMAETRINYSYVVPLNQDAVIAGVSIGLLAALVIELLIMALARLFRGSPQPVRRY